MEPTNTISRSGAHIIPKRTFANEEQAGEFLNEVRRRIDDAASG